MKDPKEIVRNAYNKLGSKYRLYFEKENEVRYAKWLQKLKDGLPNGAKILELGCGDGLPVAKNLSDAFEYIGIDIASKQIEFAKNKVPKGVFKVADMTTVAFSPKIFDGIIALYSIIHIPLTQQQPLFQNIYNWLKPGGIFLCVLGATDWTGTEQNWLGSGEEMYWSHTNAQTYKKWLLDLGFEIIESYHVPEGTGGHNYFFLKKP